MLNKSKELNNMKPLNKNQQKELSQIMGWHDFKIDQRSTHSAYITMGDITVYVDNSTNEQIVNVWQDQPLGLEEKTIHSSWTNTDTLIREQE